MMNFFTLIFSSQTFWLKIVGASRHKIQKIHLGFQDSCDLQHKSLSSRFHEKVHRAHKIFVVYWIYKFLQPCIVCQYFLISIYNTIWLLWDKVRLKIKCQMVLCQSRQILKNFWRFAPLNPECCLPKPTVYLQNSDMELVMFFWF